MKLKYLLISLLLLVVISTPLLAQPLSEVTIHGVVTDSLSGEPLGGVLVEAMNEADTTERAWGVSDSDGNYVINLVTSLEELQNKGQLPSEFRLLQNYPNPFNPSTIIQFEVPKSTDVQLIIYNTLGQKVRTLVNQRLARDSYTVEWDGTSDAGNGVAAGIYFYQLRTVAFMTTRKMILLDGNAGLSPARYSSNVREWSQFNKLGEMMVTIRATTSYARLFERKHLSIPSSVFEFNIGIHCLPEGLNRQKIVVSDPGAKNRVYISGLPGVVGIEGNVEQRITATHYRLEREVSIAVNKNGGFNIMTLTAQAEDRLRLNLTERDKPVSIPLEFIVPSSMEPEVRDSKPTNGEKDIIIDVVIKVYFTEPIESATVNDSSFYLTDELGNRVPGVISFLEDTVAVLDPYQLLEYYTDYTITVTTEVTDLQGEHMEHAYTATFKTKPREINFLKHPNNPTFSSAAFPAWDAAYVASPTVIFDEGQYHMFYSGYNPNVYNWAIGHATSSDGITWTKDSLNNPVLTAGSPGSWDDESVLVSSVLIYGSTFHLWYTGAQTGNLYWKIGYAWSTDNGITWEKWNDPSTTNPPYAESDPVLDVGPPGSWDWRTVKSPHVILENDTFKMWYVGNRATFDQSIGYAWSDNGIEWTKDTLHNPVLMPGTSSCWDIRGVDEPCVVFDGTFYHMFYMGGLMYTDHQIGYAWSADGINWEKYDNPYTTEWPYRISDPVLKSGPYGSWDFFWAGDPWVMLTGQPGELRIWYTGYYNTRQFGYATGIMDPIELIQSIRKR